MCDQALTRQYTSPLFLKIQTKFKKLKLPFKFVKERGGAYEKHVIIFLSVIFYVYYVWRDIGLTSNYYIYSNISIHYSLFVTRY